jgi:uncharacterized DUF497 family protein
MWTSNLIRQRHEQIYASKGEQRFVTLGMDSLGRVLVVVHTPRGDRVRLISARKASKGEVEQYHA